jgi:hypothetical protein
MNGYPVDLLCAVCDKWKNNVLEPRFAYVICEDHQYVRPVDLDLAKTVYRMINLSHN